MQGEGWKKLMHDTVATLTTVYTKHKSTSSIWKLYRTGPVITNAAPAGSYHTFTPLKTKLRSKHKFKTLSLKKSN